MDASLIKDPALLKKYLKDNGIIGVYVDKDNYSGSYKVFEAVGNGAGYPTGDFFKVKKAAHLKALKWANHTGLPVIKSNPAKKVGKV